MFVLDTNTLIHALKDLGHVRDRIVRARPADIAIPAIVAFELEFGTLRSARPEKRRRDLDQLFGILAILPFDGRAAARSARVRYELESTGDKIRPFDLLIAGTALAHGGILVTHNTAEFSRVRGLQLEDWF